MDTDGIIFLNIKYFPDFRGGDSNDQLSLLVWPDIYDKKACIHGGGGGGWTMKAFMHLPLSPYVIHAFGKCADKQDSIYDIHDK